MLNKQTNFSPHGKDNDGGLISLIKNRMNLLIVSLFLLCFLFVFGGVKADALVSNEGIDVTLSDSLDFALNPEETSGQAVLTAKNNNTFADAYIDKIEIVSQEGYSLVANTKDFTKEVNTKNYAISQLNNDKRVDLSVPFTEKIALKDYNYELKTSIQTSTTSNKCADIVYTISTIQNTYNISYNLNGGQFEGEYPKTYDNRKDTLLVNPVRTGYEFKGWKMSFEGLANSIELLDRNNGNASLDFYLSEDAMLNCDGYFSSPRDNASIINNDTSEIFLIQDGGNQSFTLKKGNYTITAASRGSIYINIFSSVNNITSIPKGTTGDISLTAEWVVEPFLKSGPEFNKLIPSGTTAIEFVDTKAPSNASLIDLSRDNNMSVVGWLDSNNGTFYVSTQRTGVKAIAHQDCSKMFCGAAYGANKTLRDVNSIKFNNLIDTLNAVNMSETFSYTGFNTTTFIIKDLDNWNVSNVTDMSEMFLYIARKSNDFNIIGLDNWNVSNVINMSKMFYEAGQQAEIWSIGDLSNWNVSNVTDMSEMFHLAGEYATNWSIGDLSNWNVDNVTNMYDMFSSAGSHATNWSIGDLSDWDTRNVTTMYGMFDMAGAKATIWNIGNLSKWNVSNVTTMSSMFNGAGEYATTWSIGDLSNWDTSNVTKMRDMFSSAGSHATNAINCGITIMNPNTDVKSMFPYSFEIISDNFLVYDNGDERTFNKAEEAVATKSPNSKVYHVRDINYNVNGGTMPSSYEKTYIGDKEVTLPIPTKNAVEFAGWHLKEDFSDNPITTLPTNLTGRINVYAEWESPYKINYNLDGGILPSDAPKTYYSSQGLDKLPTPTKDGYQFKGWNKKIPYSYYSENNTWKTDGTNYWTNGSEKNTKIPSVSALAPLLSFEFELKTHGNLSFFITNPAVQGKENQVKIYKDNQLIKEIYLFEDRGDYGASKEVNVNELLTEGQYKVEILQYYADYLVGGKTRVENFSILSPISSITKGTTGDLTLTAEWEEMKRMISGTQFNEKLKNEINNITEIEFVSQIDSVAKDNVRGRASRNITVYDLSQNQDKSVLGWIKGGETKLYISGDGAILANEDCSSMFEYCYNVQSFKFNNLLDVSQTKNMSSMFAEVQATSLTGNENWNTSSVEDMSYIFYHSYYLNGSINVMNPNVNLSSFVASAFDLSSEGFFINYTKDTKSIVEDELARDISHTWAQLGREL